MPKSPPPFHPPPWHTLAIISVLHGILLGALILAFFWTAPHIHRALMRPLSLTLILTAFVALVIRFPYLRTALVASWLSPLTAWTALLLLGLPGTQGRMTNVGQGVVFFVSLHTIANFVTSAATFPTLHVLGCLPERDPTRCPKCGYSLAGLESPCCPECGDPQS